MRGFLILKCVIPAAVLLLSPVTVQESSALDGIQLNLRWEAQDARLTAPLIAETTDAAMTQVACAATCLKLRPQNCSAVSFVQIGGVGTCRLGTDPTKTEATAAGSNVYSVLDNSPTVQSNPVYTRAAVGVNSIGEARAYCVRNKLGNLPTVYPSNAAFNATLSLAQTNDVVYIDVIQEGTYSQRRYATGLGIRFNASTQDFSQHWGSNQPDSVDDYRGFTVVLKKSTSGWDDVSASGTTNQATAVICVDDGYPYRFIPNTGKYYRLFTENKTRADAQATCVAEGGNLANPLKVGSRWDVLELYYLTYDEKIWLDGYLQADNTTWSFADGSLVSYTSPQMTWASKIGGYVYSRGSCMLLSNGGVNSFLNAPCTELHMFLCERASLTKP